MENINNKTVIIVMAVVTALFTPAVSWAFALLGFSFSIVGTVIGAINGLGLLAVLAGIAIFRYQEELKSFFLGEEDDRDDNEDPFL